LTVNCVLKGAAVLVDFKYAVIPAFFKIQERSIRNVRVFDKSAKFRSG